MIKLFQDSLAKFYALLLGTDRERDKQQQKIVADPTKKPWPAVCHLQSTYVFEDGKEVRHGTGFLISETTVITAAHNLCTLKGGKPVEPTHVTATLGGSTIAIPARGRTYDPRYADFSQKLYTTSQLIRQNKLTDPQIVEFRQKQAASDDPSYYDYGAVFLDDTVQPRPGYCFKLRGTDIGDPLWDKPLNCAGYPIEHRYQLCCAEGIAHPTDDNRFLGDKDFLVVHNVFATGGQSGGPLYVVDDDGDFVVIGIFVRSNAGEDIKDDGSDEPVYTNGAVRITREMESLFRRWDDENRARGSEERGPQGLTA
jgi:V8-like Glu-specific endopeptidase